MTYTIEKWVNNDIVANYGGGYTEADVKAITKGFKEMKSNDDDLAIEIDVRFFMRRNSDITFVVEPEV